MSRRIDDTGDRVAYRQPEPPRPPQPPPTPEPLPTNDAAKRADVQAYGNSRREQIYSAYAGIVTGAATAQRPFTADALAQKAYQQAYGESLQKFTEFFAQRIQPTAEKLKLAEMSANVAGAADRAISSYYAKAVEQLRTQPEFKGTPMSMVDVAADAGKAYRTELQRFGYNPLDIGRPNPHRAADFLKNYGSDPNAPLTRLSPEELQSRINNGASPGDYFARITGEPYMHTPDAVLSPSPRAWMTSVDEAAGFKLNAAELFAANGLSSNTPVVSQKMIVTNAADRPSVPATWESMISTAQSKTTEARSGFEAFIGKDESFWNAVRNLDYKTALDTKGNMLAADFAVELNTRQKGSGDVFLARNAMDTKLGVNKWFRGDGLVTYPDGTPSAREFGVGESPMRLADRAPNGRFPEISVLNLDATGAGAKITQPNAVPVETTPHIPGSLNTVRAETRNGALAGGGISLAVSTWKAFDDVSNGRRSVGDAALDVGKETLTGTAIGGGSALIENYATRGVSTLAGGTARTAFGQMGRQALGSGAAGAVINVGFALHDNYAAYQRGDISGAQYTGNIVAEGAVGAAAGVGGAMAGAYIGGIIGTAIPIPVVGTLAGAAVGMAVGVGVDYAVRKLGIDKAIASGVTATIDAGGRAVNAIGDAGNRAVQAGTRVARQAGAAVVEGARAVVRQHVETVRAVARTVTHGARAAREFVGQAARNAGARISQGTRAAAQYVTQVRERVTQTVNNAVNTARQTVTNVANTVTNTVSNAVDNARQAASNMVGGAVSNLRSAFGF